MAIDFFLHVVPGGTVGIGPQPSAQAYELIIARMNTVLQFDWAFFQNGTITLTNAADTGLGIVGWRVNLPLGVTGADVLGGVGIYGEISGGVYFSGPHFPMMASLFSGAATGAAATLYGYYFMETEVVITNAVIGNVNEDFAFHVSPSWCSGGNGNHFSGCNGFGLVWSARLNSPNWHLYIASASAASYFALFDTGVSALDGVIKGIRVEWGFDVAISKPVIRALIDGVVKGELVGPFTLDTALELGAFSQGACVGLDICDPINTASSFNAFFGMASGIRVGGFLVTPPSPPVPPAPGAVTNCTIGVPIFVDESNGSIQTLQPCSGTGQGTQGGSACG